VVKGAGIGTLRGKSGSFRLSKLPRVWEFYAARHQNDQVLPEVSSPARKKVCDERERGRWKGYRAISTRDRNRERRFGWDSETQKDGKREMGNMDSGSGDTRAQGGTHRARRRHHAADGQSIRVVGTRETHADA
jgi:hypothetical protein